MKKDKDLYTPQELIDEFPELKKIGWNAVKIGVFFYSKLLTGYYSGKEKKVLVTKESVKRLVAYMNQINQVNINFDSKSE